MKQLMGSREDVSKATTGVAACPSEAKLPNLVHNDPNPLDPPYLLGNWSSIFTLPVESTTMNLFNMMGCGSRNLIIMSGYDCIWT